MRTSYRDYLIEYDAVRANLGKPNANWNCSVSIFAPGGGVTKHYATVVSAWSLALARMQALRCAKEHIDANLGAAPYVPTQEVAASIPKPKSSTPGARLRRLARELTSSDQVK